MDIEIEAGSLLHNLLDTRIKQLELVVANMQKQKIKDDILKERIEEENVLMQLLLKEKKTKDQDCSPLATYPYSKTTIPDHLSPVPLKHQAKLRGYRFMFKAEPNGACLENSTAVHIHEDKTEGSNVKKRVNNHIADNWDNYYQHKILLPYKETVGVGKDAKQIEKKTKEEMLAFLRSDESLTVYSNTQELLAIANLYNVNIDIFTYGGSVEESWTQICPDPEMVADVEAKFGKYIPDMALYHSRNTHYDLLVKEDCKTGSPWISCWCST